MKQALIIGIFSSIILYIILKCLRQYMNDSANKRNKKIAILGGVIIFLLFLSQETEQEITLDQQKFILGLADY